MIPLPDDEVLGFRVVRRDSARLFVEVRYRVNPAHERVLLGGRLVGAQSGFRITRAPPPVVGAGSAVLELRVLSGISRQLELWLYEPGTYPQAFACSLFPFRARFG